MIDLEIKRDQPIIKVCDSFLTTNECEQLIQSKLDLDYVIEKVTRELGIDKSNIDTAKIVEHTIDETTKRQVDYLGTNRVSTILISLTTCENEGEIYFPWLRMYETPSEGKLIFIDYNYSDPGIKIKTEYQHMPIKLKKKYTLVIQIVDPSKEVDNYDYYSNPISDSIFELECGPDDDRRIMKVTLPANKEPGTAILVGVSGGMDSSLLLYILGLLNSYQTIPYFIQPITVNNNLGSADDPNNKFSHPIQEEWNSIGTMIDMIRTRVGGNILNHLIKTAPPDKKVRHQRNEGLKQIFFNQFSKNRSINFKFVRYSRIYVATNQTIELEGVGAAPHRFIEVPPPWLNPFISLLKPHIVDAIIKLNLEEIFQITPKCRNHTTLEEVCSDVWQCNERRRAFIRLNKEKMGRKYFTGQKEFPMNYTTMNMSKTAFDKVTANFEPQPIPDGIIKLHSMQAGTTGFNSLKENFKSILGACVVCDCAGG